MMMVDASPVEFEVVAVPFDPSVIPNGFRPEEKFPERGDDGIPEELLLLLSLLLFLLFSFISRSNLADGSWVRASTRLPSD